MAESGTNVYVIDKNGDIFVDIIDPDDTGSDIDSEDDEKDYFDENTYEDLLIKDLESRGIFTDDLVDLADKGNDAHEGDDGRDHSQPDQPNQGHPKTIKKPLEENQQKVSSFQVSSKCLTLASGYFEALFRTKNWIESQKGRVTISAGWGTKAFKILMYIAHMQFHKVPDMMGVSTLSKLVIAADYLLMIEVLNPWLFRWRDAGPTLRTSPRTLEKAIKLINTDLHLCFRRSFNETFEYLVQHSNHKIESYGVPVPQSLLDCISKKRLARINKLFDNLDDIIDVLVHGPQLGLQAGYWCSPTCRHIQLGLIMARLHRLKLYPDRPEEPYEMYTYDKLHTLLGSAMGDVELHFAKHKDGRNSTCSFDWALWKISETDDLDYKMDEFLPGWRNSKLKTWIMYRKDLKESLI